MTQELYKKHRPKLFKDIVGQHSIKNNLLDLCKKRRVPHCILFSGPSGTGKTTLARIVAAKLGCGKSDLSEMNAASTRGIDDVRDKIERRMGLAPIGGASRVWIIDEAHKLTNDAQNSLLKILEEPPKHVYFMLCTTIPGKLIPTIRNRCTRYELEAVSNGDLELLIKSISEKEKFEVSEGVIEKIVECSEGSPRKALVYLDKILTIEDEKDQINAIYPVDADKQADQLVKLILFNPKIQWKQVAELLKQIEENEESMRHRILGYARKVLLGAGKFAPKAYAMIQAFRDPFYECGRAGFDAACYEVIRHT